MVENHSVPVVGDPTRSGYFGESDFRRAMGHYPSGVTIVTSLDEGEPVGFSCQSFHSLSLQPPLILLLVGRNSTTWPRIARTGQLCVNILSGAQEALASKFAVSGADKFSGVDWVHSELGLPAFEESAFYCDCRLVAQYDGGDHLIVTAEVVHLGVENLSRPLLFHRGAFGTVGEAAG